jgi:hypothetical protein
VKPLIFMLITGATITVSHVAIAEVLHIPEPQEVCYETKDAAGSAVTNCETMGVHGYDAQFCRPLPGFDENYVVAEWVGSTWWLIDCTDGRTVDILVRDIANGIELENEMLTYRERLLNAGAKPTITEIAEHMASLGSKFEFRAKILSPEEKKRFCSYAVVREEPCLSGAHLEEN